MRMPLLFLLIAISSLCQAQSWRMAEVPLSTPWAAEVSPDLVLPEYPRPAMVRERWQNLNGLWQFEAVEAGQPIRFGKKLAESILVPFAWESALSGQRRQLDSRRARYRRMVTLPEGWKQDHVLLHFGAVDWEATVYLNGHFVGQHRGGYDAFSFDITPFISADKEQELIVEVWDPGNEEPIAYGKQNNTRFDDPRGYAYAPASGIWQTVWMEPVSAISISDFHAVPNLDARKVSLSVDMANKPGKTFLKAFLSDSTQSIATSTGSWIETLTLKVPNPRVWTPEDPFLYPLTIEVVDSSGKVYDRVEGYVGMRKISIEKNEFGAQMIMLNNEFLFQMGPLDQGYWPDGIYTAPTDEALRWDIEQMKAFGYNMVRKHIKVEPQRWYYWCDKLGLIVWQDMPSAFTKQVKRTEEQEIQFECELQRMVKTHWNHPSIVNWIVFNEHWGIYDVERLTEFVMALDPSRLVTGNSGIDAGKPDVDFEVGHIKDNHSYRPPSVPFANDKRAVVNGEYGAIGYLEEGHVWDTDGPWVHFNYDGNEAATTEYEKFIGMILEFKQENLSAAVYTQWTDVENEMNGIYTYDRKVIKLDQARVKAANESTWKK